MKHFKIKFMNSEQIFVAMQILFFFELESVLVLLLFLRSLNLHPPHRLSQSLFTLQQRLGQSVRKMQIQTS